MKQVNVNELKAAGPGRGKDPQREEIFSKLTASPGTHFALLPGEDYDEEINPQSVIMSLQARSRKSNAVNGTRLGVRSSQMIDENGSVTGSAGLTFPVVWAVEFSDEEYAKLQASSVKRQASKQK